MTTSRGTSAERTSVVARLRRAGSRVLDVIGERGDGPGRPVALAPIQSRMVPDAATTIGVFVYRGVSSGEVDQPVTRLAERLNATVVTVGPVAGRVHAIEPSRAVDVDHTLATAPPIDVLVVPGGLGWKQVIDDEASRVWLANTAATARGILAMSTGSLLLASVGRLDGLSATGHWLAGAELEALGASVASTRTASDDGGRTVTASGALAAMDVVDDLANHANWAHWAPGDSASSESI